MPALPTAGDTGRYSTTAADAWYERNVGPEPDGPTGAQAQKNASTGEAGTYRAERPQNVELPTVPIINLSMENVATLNGGTMPRSGNVIRKQAVEHVQEKLGLNSNVTRNGDDYVLKIIKSSLKKCCLHLTAESYRWKALLH